MEIQGKVWWNRAKQAIVWIAIVLILLFAPQAYRAVESHIRMVDELRMWAEQQRMIMVENARRQGLIAPQGSDGAQNSKGAEGVGGGATP